MPPYPPRNPSGIFSLFSSDNKDRPTRIMQTIGVVGLTVALLGSVVATMVSKLTTTHTHLLNIIGGCAGIGGLIGILMFIGVGARVMGEQNGVHSFAGQIFRILWRTFIFFLLPILIVTIIAIVFFQPKQ